MNRRTVINPNDFRRILTAGAAILSFSAAIMLATGCSKGTPQAKNEEARPTPPSIPAPGQNPKLESMTPAMAASLGLDLPDMQIPTQEQIDAAVATQINASNADKEFAELQKDIDSDGG